MASPGPRRSGHVAAEQDYQLRRVRSLSSVPFGRRTSNHVLFDCPACEDPWVGRLPRSSSSSELYPVRRAAVTSPVIANADYFVKNYTQMYKTPWYDRARKYHWDGGYMSPRRYYPSPLGGYNYISAPQGSTFYYPNDWYHKFNSVPLGSGAETLYPRLTTSRWDYDYLPASALTHSDGLYERGPNRAMRMWENDLLDYSTLDRYWLGRDSLYRRLTLSNRQPHDYADYPFGSYHRRSRPWALYP